MIKLNIAFSHFIGEIYLFCKGADSSVFPRVIEGKVDQIRDRVEHNAVVSDGRRNSLLPEGSHVWRGGRQGRHVHSVGIPLGPRRWSSLGATLAHSLSRHGVCSPRGPRWLVGVWGSELW